MSSDRLVLPHPLPHQVPVLDSPARFKLWRAGRRTGKSRSGVIAGVAGHGPRTNNVPLRRGILQGVDVLWLTPDYPQSRAIWREEIRPRFGGLRCVELNESERRVSVAGLGTLEMRSAEAVDGVRGKKYGGVIVDEAAYQDLEYALRAVLRPALADLEGWMLIYSTPKLGSFFNTLAEEIDAKRLSGDWVAFHNKTGDNEKLARSEVAAMYADYPPGSTDAAQELDAEILTAHGELFHAAWFCNAYEDADATGMTVRGERIPFSEVRIYVDLAASLKQAADYTVLMVAGLTAPVKGRRQAAVLDVVRRKLEGPDQITLIGETMERWRPSQTQIEAVAYQLTAVQHLRRQKPGHRIVEVRPDKDKRSRAVSWAAALGRGDVFYPSRAGWLDEHIREHVRFTGDGALHDDQVDTGSLLGADLVRPTVPDLAPLHF